MRRPPLLALLLASALPLGGCVAGVAAGAVGMAVQSARPQPVNNQQLQPTAVAACRERAAALGETRIIDVEQHSPSKIIVWGAADDGKRRRSFECAYGTKITGFKVRPITGP